MVWQSKNETVGVSVIAPMVVWSVGGECLPLDRNVEVGNVAKHKVDQLFVAIFAQKVDEALSGIERKRGGN